MENKMSLIEVGDMQKAIGLKGGFGRFVAKRLIKWLEIDKLNEMQGRLHDLSGPEFASRVLEECGVSYDFDPEQLERIPAEGGFITVSNHPIGSLDGLILAALIGARRPDFRIVTTFLLSLIPGLSDWFIPVDNFSSGAAKSVSGIRRAISHIREGGALGFFPAGEVSTWQRGKKRSSVGKGRKVEDIPWARNIMKIVANSGLPVIPVYFEGENSRAFHLLGLIHPRLRTVRLIHEMLNKRGATIRVRIGKPISASEIAAYDVESLGAYLRSRCYALQAQCIEAPDAGVHDWKAEVAPAIPAKKVRAEIEGLSDHVLFDTGEYRVYLIRSYEAPSVMREIYRLREENFRAIGEGTGLPLDTDPYDTYYHQMILWHVANAEIAGAYRIGFCGDIIRNHGGVKGVYSASLFRYRAAAEPLLSTCMELGRSFVTIKYQREIHPLRLLFAGLLVSALKCPEAQYFIGPVSISNDYPDFYKSLAYHWLMTQPPFENAGNYVQPSHPFVPDFLTVNPEALLSRTYGDVERFNRLITTISDGEYRLPVLIRKYYNCSARIACFNVDPLFSNSLDGLIFLNFPKFPKEQLLGFMRGLPEDLLNKVLMRFGHKAEDC